MAIASPTIHGRIALAETLANTVDHKKIGLLYIVTSALFLIVGGLEAVAMRLQLVVPQAGFIGPKLFNQCFTMHGTTMVFFVGMPILVGFGNYLVPLMIGARDMAFPRLNALGYWLYLFGGLLTYFSFLAGGAPDVGWFAYAPLTEYAFSRGNSTDYWILGLAVSGFGTLASAVNLVATILTLRCPGMTLGKVPLFVWMMFFDAVLILFAIPPLTAAQIMLLFDRQLGSHFFDVQAGGSAMLWQHLFWFFGHPEVYILILPAFGIISEVIPVFSRKVIFGYESVAGATIAIAMISMGVWAHHMFAVGMSPALDAFFSGASLLIAVPTGIKMFNWLATLYGGQLVLTTSMLFSIGFLSMFVMGGLTGIMLAAAPFDWQVTDTYFVVGHFHFVLFGGTIFALFAGGYYWFPKMTGRLMSERLGVWHFWLMFVGFNLTFVPMHVSGLLGMPRRIYTYQPDRGWELWNQLSTLGALVQLVAFLVFFVNMAWSIWKGAPAGADPWDAWTLEWSTSSPPPDYNFASIPVVKSRRPLWDIKHPDDPDWKYEGDSSTADEPRRSGAHGTPTQTSRTPAHESWTPAQVGMISFLLSEVAFFGTLIVAYLTYFGRDASGPTPASVLDWRLAALGTFFLLSSSATVTAAHRALASDRASAFYRWWIATIVLGVGFLGLTGFEWAGLIGRDGLTIGRNLFGSTYFTLVGFHAFHVTLGLVAMSVVALLVGRTVSRERPAGVELVSWYWHFVDVVWIAVFGVVYLAPIV